MKQGQYSQEQIATLSCAAPKSARQSISAIVPRGGHHRNYLLPLAQQVRRHERLGSATPARTRKRDRPPQASARRTRPGSGRAQNVPDKKIMGLAAQREAVACLQQHGLSKRRAGVLVGGNRATLAVPPAPRHKRRLAGAAASVRRPVPALGRWQSVLDSAPPAARGQPQAHPVAVDASGAASAAP